jgi:hypothetical protein
MLPGIVAVTIGVLALAIATVEYLLFADITKSLGTGEELFGMSRGTAAYVLSYAGAGLVLIALGLLKIHRARRGR